MPAPPPLPELSAHLGYRLRAVSNHVSHAFAGKLAARDVTVAEWVMLRALYDRAPTPPSRLAEELGLTRGAVTKLADRLIGKALIARRASREDGRTQTLALTARGTALVPALADLADRNDAEFFGALSARDRAALERLLKRLAERAGAGAVALD